MCVCVCVWFSGRGLLLVKGTHLNLPKASGSFLERQPKTGNHERGCDWSNSNLDLEGLLIGAKKSCGTSCRAQTERENSEKEGGRKKEEEKEMERRREKPRDREGERKTVERERERKKGEGRGGLLVSVTHLAGTGGHASASSPDPLLDERS